MLPAAVFVQRREKGQGSPLSARQFPELELSSAEKAKD